jgi:hypothetical protein
MLVFVPHALGWHALHEKGLWFACNLVHSRYALDALVKEPAVGSRCQTGEKIWRSIVGNSSLDPFLSLLQRLPDICVALQ